jgi:hypothetical protein
MSLNSTMVNDDLGKRGSWHYWKCHGNFRVELRKEPKSFQDSLSSTLNSKHLLQTKQLSNEIA